MRVGNEALVDVKTGAAAEKSEIHALPDLLQIIAGVVGEKGKAGNDEQKGDELKTQAAGIGSR